RRLPNCELSARRFHTVESPVIFVNGSVSKSIRPRSSASSRFAPMAAECTHCHLFDGGGNRMTTGHRMDTALPRSLRASHKGPQMGRRLLITEFLPEPISLF